ncbi:hypothetical protein QOZ80_4AG0305570 [Eleusine coracana subsp. coracana]|nr:hypothetical protein QOZ80_4AG0305570 [Eleusine coracana subsp. coracana]
MKASKSHELVTDVTASELWKIYSTLRLEELARQLLPQVLQKLTVICGDGGVGTVIQVTVLTPGNSNPVTYKQEFVKIDNKNYIRELTPIEGDFLNLGFTKYVTRFEIIRKGPKSLLIKSSVVYEFDDGRPELEAAASTTPLALAARAIVKYVKEQKATETSS